MAIVLGLSEIAAGQVQTLPPALQALENQRIGAVAKAARTAVSIFGPGGNGGGSGVVVSPDGYAVTNFHVIQSCKEFMKCSMADGQLYDAVIVGIDATGDVALIKLLGRDDFPAAEFADSDSVRPGDTCFAVGNPFLLATDFQPTVSLGIVSGTHRYQYPAGTILEYTDCIQTDAAINPGNSGGPLFDAKGHLIGINGRGSFEKRGRVNVGVGYAISSNQIQLFLSHLKSGRLVDHATTGFTVGTDNQGRVRVDGILESSDAYQMGVREDDLLLSFADRKITSANQFKNILGIYPKGYRVPVKFSRAGRLIEFATRLTGVHGDQELMDIVAGNGRPAGSNRPPNQPDELPVPLDPTLPGNDADTVAPAGFQDMYHQRAGFANYRFNQSNVQRVWRAFSDHGRPTAQPAMTWRLIGQDQNNKSINIVLGDLQSGIKTDDEALVLNTNEDIVAQARGSVHGRLLLALHFWRQLLIKGPVKFGQVVYWGQIQSPDNQPLELIVGTRDVIQADFMFRADTGHLVQMETTFDDNSLPCIIQFADYQTVQELSFPRTVQFRVAGETQPGITIERIEFLERSPPKSGATKIQ